MSRRKKVFICNLLIQAIGILTEIVVAYMQEAIVLEVTEGIKFNWSELLHNRLFWGMISIQFLHLFMWVVHELRMKKRATEEKIQLIRAIESSQRILVRQIPDLVARGEYDSAHDVILIINELGDINSVRGDE